MASFFGKLKSNSVATSPSTSTQNKKDPNAPQPTPLEKMLQNAGPIRDDGSDKFFGMENFGNTCYCNSILQCLYYSVPFRDSVLNFPKRSPLEALNDAVATLPRIPIQPSPLFNGNNSPSSTKPKPATASASARNPGAPVTQQQKPEDKDSPEYKKKQAMLAGPVLSMAYDNSASYGMNETLFTSLKDIFEAVVASQSRMGVISPAKFLEVLRKENEMFRTSMHQDAHEFLNLLLNSVVTNVEENAKRSPTYSDPQSRSSSDGNSTSNNASPSPTQSVSKLPNGTRSPSNGRWVHELFEGTLTSETRCLTCENVSQRDEAFLDLSVDLEQHTSVTSCLRKFSEEEMLCERNKFHCDNCGGLQEAERRMKIKRLPKILALHLKRFKYTEDLQRLQKLFHRVVYPYHIRLFNTTDDAEDPDRLYELYAVVVHIGGGPYHGHYIAIIKTEDRGWLLFDDELVEPVDKSYVQNFFGDRPGLACAYVLFYQETTFEAMRKEQEAEGQPWTDVIGRPLGLEEKANGVASAELHRVSTVATSPAMEDTERFANLRHAATAPQLSPQPKTPLTPLQPIASAEAMGPVPVLSPKKSDVQSKKERAKEEKERRAAEKAAEKEAEKLHRQRLKDEEDAKRTRIRESAAKFREAHKKQEMELKAAIEASKLSKAEEDRRAGLETSKENGAAFSSLNRFKSGSKSIRKAKLHWGSKDKEEKEVNSHVQHVPSTVREAEKKETADRHENKHTSSPLSPGTTSPEKQEKARNRFSLKKRSLSILS